MIKRRKKVTSAMIMSAIITILFGCEPRPEVDDNRITLSAAEMELYNLLMTYRSELGLDDIPLSSSLTVVAQTHVADLQDNNPITSECNSHSWSENGEWTPCCYTADHAQASCMWNKPGELTDYPGNGYEIASFSTANITPTGALNSWKSSPNHDDVVTNTGKWSKQWKAIGIGINGRYAAVWFGREEDPAGQPR